MSKKNSITTSLSKCLPYIIKIKFSFIFDISNLYIHFLFCSLFQEEPCSCNGISTGFPWNWTKMQSWSSQNQEEAWGRYQWAWDSSWSCKQGQQWSSEGYQALSGNKSPYFLHRYNKGTLYDIWSGTTILENHSKNLILFELMAISSDLDKKKYYKFPIQ